MTTTPPDIDAFERVIAAWSDTLDCQANTKLGAQCRRPARWRLDLHGCHVVLLCGNHLRGLGTESAGDDGAVLCAMRRRHAPGD